MKEEYVDELDDTLDDVEPVVDNPAELYEHFRVVVDKGQSQVRVDKYLFERLVNSSRNRIQKAADAGLIMANGKPVKSSYKVKPCDVLTVMMDRPRYDNDIIPEDIPLDIVYEDNDLMVVNKPAGLVVHPGCGNYHGTLVNAIAWHLKDNPKYDPNDPQVGLVHRIDKDTSGLLVVAKTPDAKTHLGLQFYNKTTKRKYNALVWGVVENNEGTIEGNIGRNPKDRMQMAVLSDPAQGKHAVTHYRVLERLGYVTLVECVLETGRTHQIRVHMKHIGHTLFNDERYGGNEILKGTHFSKYKQFVNNCFETCPRQALHAMTLGFVHPRTGEEMFFTSPLPEDMTNLIDKWRQRRTMKRTIAIVAGGDSSELVVSLRSAQGLYSFIDKERYNLYIVEMEGHRWEVVLPDGSKTPIDRNDFSFMENGEKKQFDFAYITIHGTPGENGILQGYFDLLGIPYSSCNVLVSAMTFNKFTCNQYLKGFGIRVAESLILRKGFEITDEEVINKIGLPCFIKPNAGGSSFGVTKVKTKEDIQPAIEKAFEESDEVMIEAFMKGTEITCGCYKTSDKEVVFPITEVVSANEFFDYGAKYNGESQEITPARLPEDTAERVRLLTSAIYDILGCSGLIRIDYIITEGEKVNLLEINTTPGMTATSFIPQQVRAAGLDIKDVMTDIIENKF